MVLLFTANASGAMTVAYAIHAPAAAIVQIAATTTNDPAVWMLIAACLVISALASAAIAYPMARRAAQRVFDRQHDQYSDWLGALDAAEPSCPAAGDTVREHLVSTDGHLHGLCPGCGKTNVPCSIIDPNLPFGPWLIDDHAPRIDPDLGLHGGECWANKVRTDDYGLCVCDRVEGGVF